MMTTRADTWVRPYIAHSMITTRAMDDDAGGHVGPPLHCAFDDHDAGNDDDAGGHVGPPRRDGDAAMTMITTMPCRGRPMGRPATMTANTTAINDQQRHSNDDSLS
jgi:hypothetical protein